MNTIDIALRIATEAHAGQTDRDGAPVRCYAVIVAPGAGRFYAGTPNDSYVQIEKTTQNVQKEINAAVANGKRVVVGVTDRLVQGTTGQPVRPRNPYRLPSICRIPWIRFGASVQWAVLTSVGPSLGSQIEK